MQALRKPVLASRPLQRQRFASTRPTLAPLPTGADALPPQHAPPAPWQRGAQALGFVLAGVAGVYSVLFYDFEQENHCFQPIRQRYAGLKKQFLTLPDEAQNPLAKKEASSTSDGQRRLV